MNDILKQYIDMVAKGYVNSLLCHSKAGYGKTHTTIKYLKENNIDYKYVNGFSTAVGLYKLLYNNNDRIIVIDDVETLFQDDKIINLLKGALWNVGTEKRIISYSSSSKVLEEYPDKFIYTGRIIILMNDVNKKNNESFNALMSRMLKYEIKYSLKELKQLSKQILEEKKDITNKEKQTIKKIIDEEIFEEHNFNFRLLERLISMTKYCKTNYEKTRELFLNSLEVDTNIIEIKKALKHSNIVSKQVDYFKKTTGKSRASFFRKRKELLEGNI